MRRSIGQRLHLSKNALVPRRYQSRFLLRFALYQQVNVLFCCLVCERKIWFEPHPHRTDSLLEDTKNKEIVNTKRTATKTVHREFYINNLVLHVENDSNLRLATSSWIPAVFISGRKQAVRLLCNCRNSLSRPRVGFPLEFSSAADPNFLDFSSEVSCPNRTHILDYRQLSTSEPFQ
jgi:hypothetical protein